MGLKYLRDDGGRGQMGLRVRLFIWFGGVVLLLVAAELVARVFVKAPRASQDSAAAGVMELDHGRLKLKPDSEFLCDGKPVKINRLSMRGAMPEAGAINIAIIGGDAVFGGRIAANEETLSELLAARIEGPRRAAAKSDAPGAVVVTDAPRFCFVNAGQPRLDLAGAKALVDGVLVPQKMRSVVVMAGYEDLASALRGDGGEVVEVEKAPEEGHGFLRGLALVRLVAGESDASAGAVKAPSVSDEAVRKGIARFVTRLREFVAACEAAEIGCIIATEPSAAWSKSAAMGPEREKLAARIGLDAARMARAEVEMHAAMESVAVLGTNVRFLDLAAEVGEERAAGAVDAGSKEAGYYAGHDPVLGLGLTRAGTLRAATAIERALVRWHPWTEAKG